MAYSLLTWIWIIPLLIPIPITPNSPFPYPYHLNIISRIISFRIITTFVTCSHFGLLLSHIKHYDHLRQHRNCPFCLCILRSFEWCLLICFSANKISVSCAKLKKEPSSPLIARLLLPPCLSAGNSNRMSSFQIMFPLSDRSHSFKWHHSALYALFSGMVPKSLLIPNSPVHCNWNAMSTFLITSHFCHSIE